MHIHFFPLDFDYKIKEGKVYVYLYGKLEQGGKICVIHEHRPYFYARLKGIEQSLLLQRLQGLTLETADGTASVTQSEEVEKELLGIKEPFLKIYTNVPKAVPPLSKQLEEWGVGCYEKDILFVHRYLRDMGITPMTLVQAEGDLIAEPSLRIPAFLATSVSQYSKEAVEHLKLLAIDIETYAEQKEIDYHKNPILMIGLYGVDEQGQELSKVLTWKRFPHQLDYLECLDDEKAMIEQWKKIMKDYQPDIITGYFSDGFDFPYLKARADKYKISLDFGSDHSELMASERMARDTEAKIKGMLHLDIFKFIRNIFGKDLKTDVLKLDAVSEELLGHKKHVVNLDELSPIWNNQPERLVDFCAYNLHDAKLAYQLCHKLLPDIIEFNKLIGLPAFDLIRMRFSRLVESYVLRRAVEFQVIAPNKPADAEVESRREESVQGAFVFEPTPGLYEKIVVFDFRSLYPTIITAHNISPEGFHCSCCTQLPHVPEKEDYWFCQREKKFLASILEELILRRVDLKRLIKEEKGKGNDIKILEARSYALKILANSFYGYLGFYGARWYCLECAASTTAYARDYIKKAIARARNKGFEVIYADTDSCFLLLGDKIVDQAMEFMNEVNFDLPGHMELDFQGYYPKGIFVMQKGSEKGAKKKYALMDDNGKIKITGFETVRRNWSLIAKEVQEKVLTLILQQKSQEALEYVRAVVKDLKAGKITNDKLIIRTQITREIEKYESVGPHVAVARKLAQLGQPIQPGTIVEYIIAKGTGIIRDRAKLPAEVGSGEYDADYYINNQLLPGVSSIFAVLGYKEDELFGESSQMGLGKFFS